MGHEQITATENNDSVAVLKDSLADCHAEYTQDLAALADTVDPVTGEADRAALIAKIEDMGAPQGGVDARTDEELDFLGDSMPKTNKAMCERDAYSDFTNPDTE